jgi:hypothetical protein
VIGLCAGFGGFAGSELPALWGGSGFSTTSVLLGLLGGCAGIWLGARLSDA